MNQVLNKPNSIAADTCRWKPSDDGVFKINTEGANDYKNRLIGFGVILRDKAGHIKAAVVHNLKAMLSPLVAEALAIKRGILLALESGLVPFQVETNSLQLVNLINKRVASSADVGPIICEILAAVESLPNWSICHVSRKGNLDTHNLAKMAFSVESECCWLDDFTPCVERCIRFDFFV
ncbi:hypothetical protein QYF36_017096 [Acer negundo]|nr:hypothetical protein QYF36_017096 [Acer negundo]